MKNILVTGAAGFIGSHLIEKLISLNFEVIGIDNFDPFYAESIKRENLKKIIDSKNFTLHEFDITNRDSFKLINQQIDLVIHLASKAGVLPSIKDPIGCLKTNILGTQNLLEFMKERSIRKMVFGSSSSIYGNNKKVPFEESDNVDYPISPYAQSKKSCELLNYTYHHLEKIDVVNLRFFTVYGPRQRPDLAIHKFTKLILNNEPITMYGNGTSSRDYTYIDDIIAGITKTIDYLNKHVNVYEIINIGGSNPIRLKDLIIKLYSIANRDLQIKKIDMQKGDVIQTYANLDKAKKVLDYNPTTSIDKGLNSFIEWYNEKNNS